MKRMFYYLAWLWLVAACGYVLYDRVAEVGLDAWLLAWQLETFGRAYLTLTTLGTLLIYGLPGFVTLARTKSAAPPHDPVRVQRNIALLLIGLGILCLIAGV